MTTRRRAAAPKLIEWSEERCVPWSPDVQVVYEHLHRYLWAAHLVHGRRMLDLASGEGFGAAILAESAESVTGVDVDERTGSQQIQLRRRKNRISRRRRARPIQLR